MSEQGVKIENEALHLTIGPLIRPGRIRRGICGIMHKVFEKRNKFTKTNIKYARIFFAQSGKSFNPPISTSFYVVERAHN